MDMPSRIEIRKWLATLERSEILEKLNLILEEHGPENEQDVRDILNHEKKRVKMGAHLFPLSMRGLDAQCGELSLLDQHEQNKADIQADIKFKNKLYG